MHGVIVLAAQRLLAWASWSSIDYYGKWKALHYKVKDAFAPVIVSHEFVDGDLLITIVSDRLDQFDGELQVVLSEFKDIEKIVRWNAGRKPRAQQ